MIESRKEYFYKEVVRNEAQDQLYFCMSKGNIIVKASK